MKRILIITNLILLSMADVNAEIIEIPEKIILSQEDFYLKGKVKTMTLSYRADLSKRLNPTGEMIIHFYVNGLVKQIESSEGVLGQEFFYEENPLKLVQHNTFYNSNKQTKINYLVGSIKAYTENHPSAIFYISPLVTNMVALKKNITYQENLEIIESYSQNSQFKFDLKSKVTNVYDTKTHKLINSVKMIPSFFQKDSFEKIQINYHDYGIESKVSKFGTTQYHYKDKELIEIISSNKSSLSILYSDYQYDSCGNWIKRKLTDKNSQQITIENRHFDPSQNNGHVVPLKIT
ncbi:hypothetical protein B9T26_14710 [Acinetobacter sp. ANC 4169]|uniref:hypothetical protein n=1 Tax=Acinetobacter sp. ANC 4169 TaxID=1977879 RepID=UPI000A344F26|nr:hypothetical protein [Acinetobacter sp. ANC 4169]OTG69801.1 hypothetical protein B9T26_14710 [Acinetobacter sp. ANC 4169]